MPEPYVRLQVVIRAIDDPARTEAGLNAGELDALESNRDRV